ncbi:MAG: NAD-glutamate dehydrogenase [Frankia sp.]
MADVLVSASDANALDVAKEDLLARAAGVGARDGSGRADLLAFLDAYYRHVAAEDLLDRSPDEVLGAAVSHRDLARERRPGTVAIRVVTPTAADLGPDSGSRTGSRGTVVEVVTDDMPFLLDSLMAELNRLGPGVGLVVHPRWRVVRDEAGRLTHLEGATRDEARAATSTPADGTPAASAPAVDGVLVESWIRLETENWVERAAHTELAQALARVLRDVRAAVEDWQPMRNAARRVADELGAVPPNDPLGELAEAHDLLRWLSDSHFTYIGYREDRLVTGDGPDRFEVVPGSELGVLRVDQELSASLATMPPEMRPQPQLRRPLIVTKSDARSTVHRPAYLDYIAIKAFDGQGTVVGERRFIGLFSRAAYTESVRRVPVLRAKVAEVLARSGLASTSHSGKDILEILETYPRDELFQTSADDLVSVVWSVLYLRERRLLRLFLRRDDYGRFMSCLVYFPRDRYTTDVRLRMERILRTAFRGSSVEYTARVSESVLARLHFVVRTDRVGGVREVDPVELEAQLAEATRSWDDDLAQAARAELGDDAATRLLTAYPAAFPEAYKEDFPVRTAVADLVRTASLEGQRRRDDDFAVERDPDADSAFAMELYEPDAAGLGERRFKIYRTGVLSLSDVLPVLRAMGVEVLDERPYEIQRADGKLTYIYDFGLRHDPDLARGGDDLARRFQETFAAVWSGALDSDGFNALVLRGGFEWREVTLLRSYARYLQQTGSPFSLGYVEKCLVANVGIARMLVDLFTTRFDPDGSKASHYGDASRLMARIKGAVDQVESLDADRILRSFLDVVRATTRTNYFQPAAGGGPKDYLSVKLDPRRLPGLPRPRPWSEIWVYSPRMEGVHLRFGPVARGGLRWSDRPEDFRTEILGLVKAQTVKNAVIVPVGAKGGFFAKRLPAPAAGGDQRRAEAVACYQTLIRGMLDLTDNLVKGTVVPPERVVRHDDDDPYLVVAADKGTATFSDIANELAAEYGYWLGDAFASGGSTGFDHKAMGITARGAWESVLRHFRELGVDAGRDIITAVGIGDMSGDVFGNGLLRSEHIRLVAAFDHRDIFLDPDPDPRVSYEERRRLFERPASSWADYDPARISAGGGVFPRSAKSIPVSPRVRERLGMRDTGVATTPAQLITAILKAPVDLLWNGGIGTYVKASWERNVDVGDRSNDAIRIDGAHLRCRVIGEGGNLGLTQLGRIEAAAAGIHVNTDAIDNSAGVDTSDHEVNIKILLDQEVRDGDLGGEQRNALLAQMTGAVADHVLRDDYEQNVVLGIARDQAASTLATQRQLIRDLEKRSQLNRALDFLPSEREFAKRAAAGTGLTSPEYAVLLAQVKIDLTRQVLDSTLPDSPWFGRVLRDYFPDAVTGPFGNHLDDHPLRREIVTTCIVNDLVNRAGTSCVFRAREETGAGPAEIVTAYTIAYGVFDLERYWRAIWALDNAVPTSVQTLLWLTARQLIDQTVRWLLNHRRPPIDIASEYELLGPDVARLTARIPELVRGRAARLLTELAENLEKEGVPTELAMRAVCLSVAFSLLDISELARRSGQAAEHVAHLYFSLADGFHIDRVHGWIAALPAGDRWQLLARSALHYDLSTVLADLTADVLATTEPGSSADRTAAWESARGDDLIRLRRMLEEMRTEETFDLAAVSVVLRRLRSLART